MTTWLICLLGPPVLAQIDPHTALLEQTGWKALDAGRPEPAAAAFRQALANDPKNPRLHLGAATAAFVERQDIDARASIDRALALDPKLPAARERLSGCPIGVGDLDGAIRVFDVLVQEGRPRRGTSA